MSQRATARENFVIQFFALRAFALALHTRLGTWDEQGMAMAAWTGAGTEGLIPMDVELFTIAKDIPLLDRQPFVYATYPTDELSSNSE